MTFTFFFRPPAIIASQKLMDTRENFQLIWCSESLIESNRLVIGKFQIVHVILFEYRFWMIDAESKVVKVRNTKLLIYR